MDTPLISKLLPELLLRIFSILAQDTDANVTSSILCCKRWRPLAQAVLYRDIFLSGERLAKFTDGFSSDHEVQSLTLHFGPVLVNQYDPKEAIETTEGWLNALQRLLPRIGRMGNLECISILADLPMPYSPYGELSSIVKALPTTCVALEVDVRHSTFVQQKIGTTTVTATSHLCDSIRTVLGRTHHLRLRLPKVCSAVFGEHEKEGYQPVKAPNLRDCIINLTQRTPGTSPRASLAAPCDPLHVPHIGSQNRITSVLPLLIPKLQNFAQLNSALQRLWVIDCQAASTQNKNSWAAWIRRDIKSDASRPVPLVNIGGFRQDAWLARLPTFDSELNVDIISSPEALEAAVEDFAWSRGQTGVRLPTTIMVAREYKGALDPPRTRVQLRDEEDLSCTLWENEAITGGILLPFGPGELLQSWDLSERTPSGWKRANFTGSTMTRLNK
ncbi:hypothetical protein N0V93_005751 [Gnomoniopsis smithogilvyi]|uniref:F-box domain-containing protein n=1 Tax=Gnomoniopsis smithogilvyi TaxID=1191159 RepID=A0A9W8YX74_9PEZI|nr:hypothetical protein N0V93_005751 [Gnomoniopsis smithogilvyi]